MAQAVGRLYTIPNTFRAIKARIVVEYAGLKLDLIDDYKFEDRHTLPTGKMPALEIYKTGEFLTDSNAIAYYLASAAPAESGLVGKTLEENAQIISELFLANTEFNASWLPIRATVLGRIQYDPATIEKALADSRRFLGVYEKKLGNGKKFLVGDRFTVADVVFFSELWKPFEHFLTPEWRAEFPNVTRYFQDIHQIPAVKAVVPSIILTDSEPIYPGQA
ncbi:glutathione S-transferase [Ramicandelaber brevisporus]|nr:glutathione S-transferase [Ramicandelaber brevisporus]